MQNAHSSRGLFVPAGTGMFEIMNKMKNREKK